MNHIKRFIVQKIYWTLAFILLILIYTGDILKDISIFWLFSIYYAYVFFIFNSQQVQINWIKTRFYFSEEIFKLNGTRSFQFHSILSDFWHFSFPCCQKKILVFSFLLLKFALSNMRKIKFSKCYNNLKKKKKKLWKKIWFPNFFVQKCLNS